MKNRLLIFDFDGVVADSEILACEALADLTRSLGVPMTKEEALYRFVGKRIGDVTSTIEHMAHRSLPDFANELQRRTRTAFKANLKEVAGVSEFLAKHQMFPRCIASSSSRARIRYCLKIMNLSAQFTGGIYSADDVSRGKPFPDLFLFAAKSEGFDANEVIVIEDSLSGVQAAVSAGMRVIGLFAASHTSAENGEKLKLAGATYLAASYKDISKILETL